MFDALGYRSWLETLDAYVFLVQNISWILCRSKIEHMLSYALPGRSRVIPYRLRDVGGYLVTVGYICYRENNHVVVL
jgi:hypothetical protein